MESPTVPVFPTGWHQWRVSSSLQTWEWRLHWGRLERRAPSVLGTCRLRKGSGRGKARAEQYWVLSQNEEKYTQDFSPLLIRGLKKAWLKPGMQVCTRPTRATWVLGLLSERLQWTGRAQIWWGRVAFSCETCQVNLFLNTYGWAWKIT